MEQLSLPCIFQCLRCIPGCRRERKREKDSLDKVLKTKIERGDSVAEGELRRVVVAPYCVSEKYKSSVFTSVEFNGKMWLTE